MRVLCVSQSDQDLFVKGFGLGSESVSCIRNGLEVDSCRPRGSKSRQIAVMPRKNARDVAVVKVLLKKQPWMVKWEWVEIFGQSHEEVIDQLQLSALFHSFGHPEGFGLPVAEAIACGCAVVGYSGLGGRELFQLGCQYGTVEEVAISKEIRRLSSPESMLTSIQPELSRIEATLE